MKNKSKILIIAIFLLIGLAKGVDAQWQNVDSVHITQQVKAIAKCGNYIYVANSQGIFKSTNNGSTWTYNLYNISNVLTLEVVDTFIFAGNHNGIYRTSKNDTIWTAVYTGSINTLTAKNNTIYAGTSTGLYSSSNLGLSWNSISSSINVTSVAINDSNIFIASTTNLYKRSINGGTWISCNNSGTVTCLHTKGNDLYKGSLNSLYKTTDNANSWINVSIVDTISCGKVLSLSNFRNYIFARTCHNIYMSLNGSNWVNINPNFSIWPYYDPTLVAVVGNYIHADVTYYNGLCRRPLSDFFTLYSVNVNTLPLNCANISGDGYDFLLNDTCKLQASSNSAYIFKNWTENGNIISTNPTYTFVVTANRNIIANYVPIFTISTSSSNNLGGSVIGGGVYQFNDTCTLKAIPNTSYTFNFWTENGWVTSTDSIYTFIVNSNRNLIAEFSSICSANFQLTPDTTILHHYFIVNNASGIQPLHYHWSWGDGTSDTIAFPSHTYNSSGWYNVCLTIIDAVGCTTTYCDSSYLLKSTNSMLTVNVIPQGTLGIKENNLTNQISIYPNPTSNTLTIETNSNTKQNLEIVNLIGQTLYTSIIYSKATVDVSAFPKGIYLLKLNTDKGIVVKKFIKE